jgi:hypothetical protein
MEDIEYAICVEAEFAQDDVRPRPLPLPPPFCPWVLQDEGEA